MIRVKLSTGENDYLIHLEKHWFRPMTVNAVKILDSKWQMGITKGIRAEVSASTLKEELDYWLHELVHLVKKRHQQRSQSRRSHVRHGAGRDVQSERAGVLSEQCSKEFTLTERDIHCVARILQGVIFEDCLFFGCQYCQFANACQINGRFAAHFDVIRKKLEWLTGLYFGNCYNPASPEKVFNYQSDRDCAERKMGHDST